MPSIRLTDRLNPTARNALEHIARQHVSESDVLTEHTVQLCFEIRFRHSFFFLNGGMDFTHDCSGCGTKGADLHYSSLLYRISPSVSQYRIHSSLQIFEHSAFAFPGIQNAIATFIRVYGSLSSYKLITNLNREPFTRRCFRKGLLISVGRRASTLPTIP